MKRKSITMQNQEMQKVVNPIAEEAARGFVEMVSECRNLRDKHKEELENMRIHMTHNFNALMNTIEENCKPREESDEEIAKRWIRDNLEEAQHLIDNIVGIKGITEDSLKVAAELEGVGSSNAEMPYGWNVIAANTAGTLQRELVAHDLLSQAELYGY